MSVPAFIDLTESDQVAELRDYFHSKDIKVKEVENGELCDNVKAIIEAISQLWKENEPKDIQGIVNSVLSLLFVIPVEKGKSLVVELCDQLMSGATEGKSAISLKLLHNLFHGYHEKTPFLYHVYCTWVKVAASCKSIHSIPTDMKQVEAWMTLWQVSDEERRELLRLLYEADVACRRTEEAAEVMVRLLESYSEETASQAHDDAVRCVTRALSDPNTYLFDQLLALKPVQFLEGEPLHDLLNIFVSGNVRDYHDFHASNPGFVDSIGLSHSSNVRKMRLLTLVDAVGGARDITFDDVISRLGVSEEEVEEFIIGAMQSKLIRGRIDHVNRKLVISQACQRTFGRPQWQLLASRLQHWKNNLKKVNDRLQTVHS